MFPEVWLITNFIFHFDDSFLLKIRLNLVSTFSGGEDPLIFGLKNTSLAIMKALSSMGVMIFLSVGLGV